ncbi:MAG: NAD(+)/NADH kinase [Bacteroidales bacterium]|nr:NAD(+)/NADH kinase [Bacteroidales bacterium]HOO66826.1 NAD(+)/NADH kinase [Bacteroidales bacterium]HPE22199.1 NAD(+)/NADH kinase [Bacteroidales bacterium]HPJ05883.1 NAD(+)/NADH kinase [Bacteroidales bacterium]HPQ63094.1 NAD(+)/NADH kinase [Bacteroidales bacterium]
MDKTIALYSKGLTEKTTAGLMKLIDALCDRGITIYLNIMDPGGHHFDNDQRVILFSDLNDLPSDVCMILSVGGDGTFLETAMRVRTAGIPVAGINTGRLGFLANIPDDDIGRSIDLVCDGNYELISRSMLEIASPENLFGNGTEIALNEVTVQKADQSMITITVKVDGIFLNTYRADGLIVSSATGSTAYNLSVGGPILSPTDDSIIIIPMSPHNLTVRPIIVTGSSVITLEPGGRSSNCLVTCDSKAVRVPAGTVMEVRQSASRLLTVTTAGNDFFSTLRNKLMWGADPRN